MKRKTKLSEQLKAVILAAPVTRYRIAQETGVSEAALSRFVNGSRLLDLSSVDKLAAYFGLVLTKGMVTHGKHNRRSGR